MKKRLEFMTAAEKRIAEKLNTLTNINTFWEDVRKFTAKIKSDKTLSIWQAWSDIRYDELRTGCEDVRTEFEYIGDGSGKFKTRYYTYDYSREVFVNENYCNA